MKIHMNRGRLIALALVLFGLGLWISAMLLNKMFGEFDALDRSFVRITVPGEQAITLAAPGNYTVFFEHKSKLDGRIYSAPENAIDGLRLTIESAGTGKEIPVTAARTSSTYSLGSREGRAILAFRAPAAGAYRLSAALDGATPGAYVLAIGQGMGRSVFRIVGIIGGLVCTILITLAVPTAIVVVALTRRKATSSTGAPTPNSAKN